MPYVMRQMCDRKRITGVIYVRYVVTPFPDSLGSWRPADDFATSPSREPVRATDRGPGGVHRPTADRWTL